MDCLEAKKNLALYLDDLLEGREADALESHLFGCASCRLERDRIERLFSYGSALPAQAPSPAVWEKLRARLREPQPLSWQDQFREWVERSREATIHYFPSYAAGAASAALLLFLIFPFAKNGAGTRLQPENHRPLGEAGLVATPDLRGRDSYESGYPVRLIEGKPTARGKRLVMQNGQLYEIEEPPAQPRVEYPVRDIGTPAVLRREF